MSRLARVTIDPGHGGPRDPGAVAGGVREPDIVLVYADALATELRKRRHSVQLTRESDQDLAPGIGGAEWKGIDLRRRASRANAFRADAFISLHCNAAGREAANGAWVLYALGSRRGEALARSIFAELAKVAGISDDDTAHEVYPDSSPATGYTVAAAAALAKRPPGTGLSDIEWLARSGVPERQWYRSIGVLRRTAMPAVLVELGFLTNIADRRQLVAPETTSLIAAAIADGLEGWLA